MTAATAGIQTPDQRLRVFVSSVLGELATERARVREAVVSLRLTPVMVELGARPHPARDLYRAYIEQSDVFIGLYWERYGWVAPDMAISGVEDEYDLCGDTPRLLYVKRPAPDREPRMAELLARIEAEGRGSYRTFTSADELVDLVRDDLALLLSERFSTAPVTSRPAQATGGRPALPAPTTPIIGREREVAAIRDLLAEPATRLVTLTGPGGIGKTRLALESATQLDDAYVGGAIYVQLASVRDPALVLPTIATAVGATVERGQPALAAIVRQVQQPLLLIPDNLEQITDAGAVLAQLLTETPMITILATSRTALRVRGEHEFQVPALDVGEADQPSAALLPSPAAAVELFADRARASRADFALTADNVATIAEICRRLDGLPLAIELAAARVRLLPPEALLTRLGNRLDTLGTGPADLPERQRTLRATIDWSFSLLDDALADVITALAVFTDGWTLEAAAAVCDLEELAALEAMDALVRQSLILTSDQTGEPRFRMLATVKEYALERLHARGDLEAIAERHARYFARLLSEAGPGLLGRAQAEWGARVSQEQGNLRAVLQRYLDRGDTDDAIHIVRAVWPFWWLRDQLFEASSWIARAMEQLDDAGPLARAELLWAAWSTSLQLGDGASAVTLMGQALEAIAAVDDPMLEGLSLLISSYTIPITGDLDAAFAASFAAATKFRAIGDDFLTGLALSGLGTISHMRGDVSAARAYHEQAVSLGRALSNDRLLGQALSSLGMTVLSAGDATDARQLIDESADVLLRAGSEEGVSLALSAYALLAAHVGDLRRAAVARGAVEEIRRRIGIKVWPVVSGVEQQFVDQVRHALGDAEYDAALAEGAAQTLHEAVAAARGGVPVDDGVRAALPAT
jgi:predicted ATPase